MYIHIYIYPPTPADSRGSASEKRGQEMEQEARKQHLVTAIASNFEPNLATTNCQTDAPQDGVQKATGGTGSREAKVLEAWRLPFGASFLSVQQRNEGVRSW